MPTYDEALFIGLIVVLVFTAARLGWIADALSRVSRALLRRR